MKTKLLNLVLTGLALLTMTGYQANAQQLATKAADSDPELLLSLDSKEAWDKIVADKEVSMSKAEWNDDHLSINPDGYIIFYLPEDKDPGVLEGEFSNGITGCGAKDFIIEERNPSVSNKWTLVKQFSPGTSLWGQYTYTRMSLKEDTKSIRIRYIRGANLSSGGVRNLTMYGDTYNDADIAPAKLNVTNLDRYSATLEWSDSKYPLNEDSDYKIEIVNNISGVSTTLTCQNTDHCNLVNLTGDTPYNVTLTRTYKGDVGPAIKVNITTPASENIFELINEIKTNDQIQSSMNQDNILILHKGETFTFLFNNPVYEWAIAFECFPDKNTDPLLSYKIKATGYDYNSDKYITDTKTYRVLTSRLGIYIENNVYSSSYKENNIKSIKKFTITNDEVCDLNLYGYYFRKLDQNNNLNFDDIKLEADEAGNVDIKFTTTGTKSSNTKSITPSTNQNREIHVALFKTDQEGKVTELVNRVVTPEELEKSRCATGERLEKDITYTIYFYTTIQGKFEDMIWKVFTSTDIATSNETITPEETGATIRVKDRQVTITRDQDMTGSMQIVSLSGQVIYSQKLHNTTEVSTTLNAPGNYIVRLILQDGVTSRKIQVE